MKSIQILIKETGEIYQTPLKNWHTCLKAVNYRLSLERPIAADVKAETFINSIGNYGIYQNKYIMTMIIDEKGGKLNESESI